MAHSRGSFRGSPRRRKDWGLGPGGVAATNSSGSTAVILGSGSVPAIGGTTIGRLRGRFASYLTEAANDLEGFQGAFAVGIVKAPAFAAGVASVPTPITEQGSENWLYWTSIQVFGMATALSGVPAVSTLMSQIEEVDTKAMRKVSTDMAIYACLEVAVIEGGATIEARFDSRALVKLP